MIRLTSSSLRRASRALLSTTTTRALTSTSIRSLSTASISSILSTGRSEWPLKDAVKFARPSGATDKSVVWTFHELNSHVNALASGLQDLGFKSGDQVVSCLPAHDTESAVLLLAAAKLRITIITINESSSSVTDIEQAINKNDAKALFLPGQRSEDDSIIASVNAILHSLDEDVALRDASGLAGFVSVTGRAFHSSKFPTLQHVIHTGADNVRCAVSFRSLLVYDNKKLNTSSSAPSQDIPLISQHGSTAATEADIVKMATEAVNRLKLSPDHYAKHGTVVVKADGSPNAASHAVAALMQQALWVSPHPDAVEEAAADSNVAVV